jgi:hypothetical protein
VRTDRRTLLRERLSHWSTEDMQTFSSLLDRLNEVL